VNAERQRHPSPQGEPSSEDTGTAAGSDPLASRLGELAREFQREQDTPATLTYLVSAAVDLIPGAQQASISVVLGRKVAQSQYPTGPLPTSTRPCASTTCAPPMIVGRRSRRGPSRPES